MKIVNSICQDMEKCWQLNAFARAEIGYCNSKVGPDISDGNRLHMFSETKALHLEMWVSHVNEKTGKQFCNEKPTNFKPEEKNQDNTYYRAQGVISQRISSV